MILSHKSKKKFSKGFLEVANLLSDYQVHKNALQALNDFYTLFAGFESIDLVAGTSATNKELNALFMDNKSLILKRK